MPAIEKVRWAQFRVAFMAAVALIILSVLVYLLLGSNAFQPRVTIRSYVSDVTGVDRKVAVRLNGVLIGMVESVRLSGLKDPQRAVEIEMLIGEGYVSKLPEDSVVAINAANVLGDKYVDITKGKSARPVRPGGALKAQPLSDLNRADLLKSLQTTLARTDAVLSDIEAGKGAVGRFVKDDTVYRNLTVKVADAQKGIAALLDRERKLGGLVKDDALYMRFQEPLRRFDDRLASIQSGQGSAGEFLKDPATYDDARDKIGRFRQSVERLRTGEGKAGKLLTSDELYSRMTGAVAKLDAAVEELNAGAGAVGELLVSPNLSESMDGATRDLRSNLKEFRANPRKFLRIRLGLF
jgi:phospholipid/cholesterol/gamma-HCH transport system substrate-binding protein